MISPKIKALALTRALILGLIIPIVESIFHLIMVAMLNNGDHNQKIEIWLQNLNHLG